MHFMPLCRRCLLAARCANTLKFARPRTVRGNAWAGYAALKPALPVARSARLRERLVRAGYDRQEALSEADYGQIPHRIAQTSGPPRPLALSYEGPVLSCGGRKGGSDGLVAAAWRLTIRLLGAIAPFGNKAEELQKIKEVQCCEPRPISELKIANSGNSDHLGQSRRFECDWLNFGIRDPYGRGLGTGFRPITAPGITPFLDHQTR